MDLMFDLKIIAVVTSTSDYYEFWSIPLPQLVTIKKNKKKPQSILLS